MEEYEASPSYSNTALKSNPVSATASGSIGNRQVNSGNFDNSSSTYQQQYNTTLSTQQNHQPNPYNNTNQQHHSANTHPGSATSSNSYPDHPHQYPQQQQQHPVNHQQQQQQQQAYQSSDYSNPQYSNTGNNHTAASAGNVNNASTTEYRQSQPQQPQSNNYSYSNSNMSTEAASTSSNRTYPHQSSHPDTSSYAATDGGGNVLQPQAPSSTTQASHPHQQQQQTQQQTQSYYSSNTNNNNNAAPPQSAATASQQQQPSLSSRNRTISGGFETVKAGPPTEGKMDLLPYPHNHHQQQQGQQQNQTQQQQNNQQQQSGSSNAHRRDSSSSRHRNRHSTSSTQVHHPQPQRPNSQINAITAQTPSNIYQGEYHEPVAPSSGRSANSKGSSTTSEFTKRKNWSQRIVEEMQDILHVLSPDGTVLFVSPSLYDLCGITPEEMVGNLITDYMDPLDVDHFKEEFENSIMTEASLTTYYRLRKRNINGVGNSSRVNSSGTLAGLGRLKEEDSDDSNHLGQHSNDLSNAAAEAFAAINLKSDTLLLEITGQPYYTSSPDGTKHHKKSSSNRRNREAARDDDDENDENENEDSRMTNAGDSGNNASSSSSSGSNAHPHKTKHSNNNNKKSNNSRSNSGSGSGTKTCKCFFAMARPYPSRNNATLDTFLELKIENEKLRNKLANIYREIEGDDSNAASGNNNSTGGIDYSGMGVTHADNGSGYQIRSSGDAANKPQQQAYFGADPMAVDTFPPHERQISGFPSRMSGVFASQQANSGNANTGRDGISSRKDYDMEDGNQSLDSPRHATQPGLGMRGGPIDSGDGLISSAGLIPSTSNTYGALGIGISANARANASNNNANTGQDDSSLGSANPANITSNQANVQSNANSLQAANAANASAAAAAAAAAAEDKKKKMKKQRTDEGEFVCRDCGTVDSPEWRRGPLGPKTLCNACGLRWAKKNKQQQRNSLGGNEVITITK